MMTSSGDNVHSVRMLVPPLLRSNFFLSPTTDSQAQICFITCSAASVGGDLKGWVACIMKTSKPIWEKGTHQAPGLRLSEWSYLMERSKGFNLGREGTMLWVMYLAFNFCGGLDNFGERGRILWKTPMTPSWMPLLGVVLWNIFLHPAKKWSP